MNLTKWRKKYNVPTNKYLIQKVNEYLAFKDWYVNSKAALSVYFDKYELPVFIDLLAAISPRNTVKQNLIYAVEAYDCYKVGDDPTKLSFGIANQMIQRNVKRVFEHKPITGSKVRPFAEALNGNLDKVVIDSWMLKAFNINRKAPTPNDRKHITAIINKLSDKTNLKPAEVQACLWGYAKAELNDSPFKESNDYSYYLKDKRLFKVLKEFV